MDLTTIQLHKSTQEELASLKDAGESYEEVIDRLLREHQKRKKEQEQLLIEGCREMAEDSLKICKEWEAAEAEWPEWRE